MAENQEQNQEQEPPITLQEFFETIPPGKPVNIRSLIRESNYELNTPLLHLYCQNGSCDGIRLFGPTNTHTLPKNGPVDKFVTYICRNCRNYTKTYSVMFDHEDSNNGRAYKYGEMPPFGPHTPPRLNKLIGEDRGLFFKGRRSESQGLGIGAFSYYRRVVENEKNRILDEIIKVSETIGASKELLIRAQNV